MVDAATTFGRKSFADSQAATAPDRDAFALVQVADYASLQAYERFCAEAGFSPAQDPFWVRAFAAHAARDTLLATLTIDGRPAIAVALEVAQVGPFRIARFPGGRHANGNFPVVADHLARPRAMPSPKPLLEAIAAARPDIDAVVLERQVPSLGGRANPFATLRRASSPNVALAVDLAGGFEQLLERASGKRKRKKHRSQMRKFDAAGGYCRVEATTAGQVDRLLDAFFEMKGERFAKMGVPDVFAAGEVRGSFRALFKQSLGAHRPRFVLHALEVGGELRAVTGSSVSGDRLVCEFGAIREDELSSASPGDFLFYENIREACARGFSVYDFSVGDEPYKRLWCDTETTQFDVHVPLTMKGRLLVAGARATASVKRTIKHNPHLRSLLKRVRRGVAAPVAKVETPDDE